MTTLVAATCIVVILRLARRKRTLRDPQIIYDWQCDTSLARRIYEDEQAEAAWERYWAESELVWVSGRKKVNLWL